MLRMLEAKPIAYMMLAMLLTCRIFLSVAFISPPKLQNVIVAEVKPVEYLL
jgi:hypothetical protein